MCYNLKKPFAQVARNKFIITFNLRLGLRLEETELYLFALEPNEIMGEKEVEGELIPYPVIDPDYEEKQKQQERERLDSLTLTPSDVERALYDAKEMDFEDLKALIVTAIPSIDLKRLAIEFRAKDFWRGATFGEQKTRLFDVIGALLGYTPEDMDYLFINKKLPTEEKTEEQTEIKPETPEELEVETNEPELEEEVKENEE